MSSEPKKISFSLNLKKNNKPLIFSVCLLIATVLWFFKALDKDYETTLLLPVRYTNVPKNNVLVNPPPSKLEVEIQAQGFTLLRHKIGLSITPVNLSIRPFIKRKNSKQIEILSDRFIPQINEQINHDITVLDVSPDTLYFQFDFLTEKKVRVVSAIQINCLTQYFVSDSVKFTPAFITVRGPVAIIDTLTAIPTASIKFSDLNTSVQSTVSLEKINQLEYSTEKVNIEIPVTQFTEYNKEIAITLLNAPDNLNIITFPGKIDVNCLVAFDKFNNISATDFIVGVDYTEITASSKMLTVKVIKQPNYIKSLKIRPTQVEYIIKQK